MSDQNQCAETPLLELARSVPTDLRAEWESQWWEDGTPCGYRMVAVGSYIHRLADEVERLTEELENELARGIHTCHSQCQRRVCVMQRRINQLEAALRSIATNTCCERCREAALVARQALKESSDE